MHPDCITYSYGT